MTLANELQQIRISLEDQLPDYVTLLIEQAIQEIQSSDVEARALRSGERAPEFELPTPDGQTLRSTELLAKGPLVLSFLRGSWCPFCETELHALKDYAPQVEELGASILALTPESSESSVALGERLGLTFPVLSDKASHIARRFRLEYELSEIIRDAFFAGGLDEAAFGSGGPSELPMPSTYVIDQDGMVRYAFGRADYQLRADPEAWLAALRKI